MKKLLAILLALVMLLSLAACGESGDEDDETRSRRHKSSDEETTEATDETMDEEAEEERNHDSFYTEFESMDVEIIDDEYATVYITDLDEDDWGLICGIEVENNTDKDISVYSASVAVNGKMEYSSFYVEAEAGDDASTELNIYDMEDPEDLTRLSMCIWVNDTEDYEFNQYYLIDIYPQGKSAYKDNKPARKGQDELVDEDEIYIAVQDYDVDGNDCFNMSYLGINETTEVLSMGLNTVSINGFGFSDYGGGYILPDTYIEDSISIYRYAELVELGMDDVTMLEMKIDITNGEYEDVYSDFVTLYPEGKSKAEEFTYKYEKDDVVIAESDAFKLTQVKILTDEWDDVKVYFILENKTGDALDLYGTEMKINGKAVDTAFYCYDENGLDTYGTISIYSSEMEELKLDEIKTMEMLLEVRDGDYESIFEETVKFDVK